ncbi:bis(5'-nucleosyl)-tetraphosphatase (symmetrical) ApaH [Phocoenobacter skyensis]|uniref:Bis(5'-nucleosyl)-tetraphosphatase, symmetrical n=1 Tax=Phocoenobacter skyensis TaxID=97481 RepID=A0A1H7U493_9PAST|nr:bis(5'-nucleosyl)-tetraphosphatase (symmetrical) ApaH [Pasteurella skyensis]MDP8078744.1 bis(5'-nucleosyl)-tetraphosphatase (symmetrical) ApaH [Pasteurella skyensis]MDP8084739.1 bis(5'-nucleosyl)-tetraphosphatase (symmetrical) ApaH [Pasteurella skyensis]MDP8184115.1 bis(5'-nucleosyl)-tetraphosphatase (symmetrical) ApaH [Pasteurella skyensis]QLB22778.1 bis(5'-nucleosyl)-tetraphosphatase (symmetrical) [Pasteurella skyensis]SEL91793.1 bis(5'-nucleosyl)-tetraphosphatase (symmetrical) [Pasteurel
MATYIVGDLHGCFDELKQLLQRANFNSETDELWFTGDLVARGNQSLACLRFVKSLGERATTVLGNHDLHLLATNLGIKKVNPRDKLGTLLMAEDKDELLEWLRYQPLFVKHPKYDFLLSHAGVSPEWNLETAQQCANEVERILQGDDYQHLLQNMYGNSPLNWNDNLVGIERYRYTINSLTRMRLCNAQKQLDFECKLPPQEAPPELKPWFEFENPLYKQYSIIFGHWAALLGYQTPSNIYSLDTGCVWGNHLTMLRWEDKTIFTQPFLGSG